MPLERPRLSDGGNGSHFESIREEQPYHCDLPQPESVGFAKQNLHVWAFLLCSVRKSGWGELADVHFRIGIKCLCVYVCVCIYDKENHCFINHSPCRKL